jgi:hypothetical protein
MSATAKSPSTTSHLNALEYLLTDVAEALAVPESAYRQAAERYHAVGNWLCAEGSDLAQFRPEVYPQGSFALGTVVKPLTGDDYDLDAVVRLVGTKASWSPATLKAAVGRRLTESADYSGMLQEEGRRCWTLQYASETKQHGFHLDLLPSIFAATISQQDVGDTSLAITNRRADGVVEWKGSDPEGYADWFAEQAKTQRQRRTVESVTVAGVEPVPTFPRQTPLRRAVQLLKRYRDVLFAEADEHAPISIIITTLAAQAYQGEETLTDALFGIVRRMESFIEIRGTSVRIPNPVEPAENFADRWQGDERKVEAFLLWLRAAQKLEEDLLSAPPGQLADVLTRLLGETSGRAAMNRFAVRYGALPADAVGGGTLLRSAATPAPSRLRGAVASVLDLLRSAPHRRRPPWEMRPDGTSVVIRGHVTGGSGARWGQFGSGDPILLHADLRFDAEVVGTRDADIYWQITNTGNEAERAGQLRGAFEHGRASKVESSRYRGDHAIECFLVRRGACIARSGEFVVSIRSG